MYELERHRSYITSPMKLETFNTSFSGKSDRSIFLNNNYSAMVE